MFLTIGMLSVIVASIALFTLPSTPMSAKFLTVSEKCAVLHHVAANATGVSSKRFTPSHIRSLVADPQVYLLSLLLFVYSACNGLLSPYAATLIKGLGYTSQHAALLHIPNGAVQVANTLLLSTAIRQHYMNRLTACLIGFGLSLTGACMLAYGPQHGSTGLHLAGIWLTSMSSVCGSVGLQWVVANVAGTTKRSLAVVVVTIAHGAGSLVGPYATRKDEEPVYTTARNTLVGLKAGMIVVVLVLGVYYVLVNSRRDRVFGKVGSDPIAGREETEEAWADLTVREKKAIFRYVL